MNLKDKLPYKVFIEKTNKKGLNSRENKPSLFELYPKEWHGAIRTFIIKAYRKGFRTYEISEALGISTRTVHKTIIKWRNGKKITMRGWKRRLPRYLRLTCVRTGVKIKRIKEIQKLFMNLISWLQNSDILDFDAIMRGKPV